MDVIKIIKQFYSYDHVTKQISYFSNKLDGVGVNRLTNPVEVGLSFLVKNCKEPEEMIYHALAFLPSIL